MITVILIWAFMMAVLSPGKKVVKESPGEIRRKDKAFRKDRRRRAEANRGPIVDENGNVVLSRKNQTRSIIWKIRFYIRRCLFKPIEILKNPLMSIKRYHMRYLIFQLEHPKAEFMRKITPIILLFGIAILGALLFNIGMLTLGALPFILFLKTDLRETLRNQLAKNGWVFASDYGNDIVAIQAAIDFMRSNLTEYSILYVATGTWTAGASDQLVFDGATSNWEGITFIGGGREATFLDFSAYTGADECVHFSQSGSGATRCWHVRVSGMTITGGTASGHGIFFDYAWDVIMSDMYFEEHTDVGFYSVYFLNCYTGHAYDNLFRANYNGIGSISSNTMEYNGNRFWDNTNIAFHLNAYGCCIHDCEFEQNTGAYAIYLLGTGNVVEETYFEKNSNVDIQIDGNTVLPQLANGTQLINNYHNGAKAGVVFTDWAVKIANARNTRIQGGSMFSHDQASIQVGSVSPGYGEANCYDTHIEDIWTGDIIGNTGQWAWEDPTMVDNTARAFRTKIDLSRFQDRVTDLGYFTITPDRLIKRVKNSDADLVCAGDVLNFDTTDNTGESMNMINTLENPGISGVVYDGAVDTLSSNAASGQKDVVVTDVWAWHDMEDKYVRLIDDSSSETIQIESIDTDTDTVTMKTNLANAYTTAANARILLGFVQNDYLNVIQKGQANYIHADGTTDIAIGDFLCNYSSDGVMYKGIDNFIVEALGAYTSNNSNGLIKGMVIPLKNSIMVTGAFVTAAGTATGETFQGWDIDAAGESVIGWVEIPSGVRSCLMLRIGAYSVGAVAQQMQAEFVVQGGQPGEAFSTHNQTYSNHQSIQTNFSAADIITWEVITGIITGDLAGGDWVKIQVNHEVGTGGDSSTDARFYAFTIYCI